MVFDHGMRFAKGHGTGNDFVIIADPDGELALSEKMITAICDRRSGLGADGLIRVVRSCNDPTAQQVADSSGESAPEWFMDYRNADGSVASMCGNGARVFARYLLQAGLVGGPEFTILTRGGSRIVAVDHDGRIAVEMGRPSPGVAGEAPVVEVAGRTWMASAWWLPNPHAVAWTHDLAEAGPLTSAPTVSSDRFATGVNVEFAVDESEADSPRARMRVYERGVGETASCGTGACAVALSLRQRHGIVDPGTVTIDVVGGRLQVTFDDQQRIWLAGPAVIVATGELSAAIWGDRSGG